MALPPADPCARLTALHETVRPADYLLERDICTLGRSPLCQIVVEQPIVSRLHAKIERAGSRHLLSDAGSTNGTFVNGAPLDHPHILQDGDQIGLGAEVALLSFHNASLPTLSPYLPRPDYETMTFLLDRHLVELSPTQFQLLDHLYQHAGEVCTNESCAALLWNRPYDPEVDQTILDRLIADLCDRLCDIAPGRYEIRRYPVLGYALLL